MCAEKQLAHDYNLEITSVEHYDARSVGKSEMDSFTQSILIVKYEDEYEAARKEHVSKHEGLTSYLYAVVKCSNTHWDVHPSHLHPHS